LLVKHLFVFNISWRGLKQPILAVDDMKVKTTDIGCRSVLFNGGSAKHVVGFREGSSFFRGNDFLLPYVDTSFWNFLDHCATFRLHVGQLVVQDVECR